MKISNNCEIINQSFCITTEKFLASMWSETPFWSKMMSYSNQSDFCLIQKNENSLVYSSKMKMINFDVKTPVLKIPKFCEQETKLSFERDGDKVTTINSVTKAANFPYADTFEIVQT